MSRWLRITLVVGVLASSSVAVAQQEGKDGMDRGGTLTIGSDIERRLFGMFICTCGTCARETLDVCTCSMAADRREAIRGMIARGMSEEEIRAAYVKEFGAGALAVPPNEGSNRILYLAPLFAIARGGVIVGTLLKRLRRGRGDAAAPTKAVPGAGGADAYDEKLDRELEELDDR